MIAVGIDVSKSKSTVAILNNDGSVLLRPYNIHHTHTELDSLSNFLKTSQEQVSIVMESTGHYHFPVLQKLQSDGFDVFIVNPFLMKKYGESDLHKSKTDKKDALMIARFALEKSYLLTPYSKTEQKYEDLRFLARQYSQRVSCLATNKVYLQNLLDETMPGLSTILSGSMSFTDNCLFVLFIRRFQSYDRIVKMSQTRFLESYGRLLKKAGSRRGMSKGLLIYEMAKEKITTHGSNEYMLMAQLQCVDLIIELQKAAETLLLQMQNIAETIPEYQVLKNMNGVGRKLGPLILAEIGDIRRFHSSKALNAYAGNDVSVYQSGMFESHTRHITKRGNAALRKYCFEVMQALKTTKPLNDPVYLFMLKKEQEGKPYNVAKMAGVNKFLRIYYARAMELYRN